MPCQDLRLRVPVEGLRLNGRLRLLLLLLLLHELGSIRNSPLAAGKSDADSAILHCGVHQRGGGRTSGFWACAFGFLGNRRK